MNDFQLHIKRPKIFDGSSRQQQEAQHEKEQRAKTALRVFVILAQFWQDHDTPSAMRALEIEGWCDVLCGCGQDEIREAWRMYQIDGPRTANRRLVKPDAGAIFGLIAKERARIWLDERRAEDRLALAPPPEPVRETRVTPEERKAIMAEVYGADVVDVLIPSKRGDTSYAH